MMLDHLKVPYYHVLTLSSNAFKNDNRHHMKKVHSVDIEKLNFHRGRTGVKWCKSKNGPRSVEVYVKTTTRSCVVGVFNSNHISFVISLSDVHYFGFFLCNP